MMLAALLAIPAVPLWMYGSSLVWLAAGAFLIQMMIQGAWGVVPSHLNELAPAAVRGTLPGVVYQAGNLLAALTPAAQGWMAARCGGLTTAMSIWIVVVALLLTFLVWVGPEAKDVSLAES